MLSMNDLTYGPGNPFKELKQSETSSITTAVSQCFVASLAFLFAISSGVPCSSSRSIYLFVMSNLSSSELPLKMLTNSSSFFLFPVINVIGNFFILFILMCY